MRRILLALSLCLLALAAWGRAGLPSHNPTMSAAATVPSAWNPADSGSTMYLTNSNLTATDGPQTLGIAVDFTAKKVWWWNPQLRQWNGDILANQNPGTSTGGLSFTATGPFFPEWATCTVAGCAGATHPQTTINTGATAFTWTLPSGYSSWNTATSATVTWNPSDKDTNITLSNGNLTATAANNPATFIAVRGTNSVNSGKAYFEVVTNLIDAGTADFIIGLCSSSCSLQSFPGSDTTAGFGWRNNGSVFGVTGTPGSYAPENTVWRTIRSSNSHSTGKKYFEISASASVDGEAQIGIADGSANINDRCGADTHGQSANMQSSNALIFYNNANTGQSIGAYTNPFPAFGIAIDTSNGKTWWYNPTTGKWNADILANQNPATGAGGYSQGTITAPYFACLSYAKFQLLDVTTFNPGTSAFSNAVPSGFGAWNTP